MHFSDLYEQPVWLLGMKTHFLLHFQFCMLLEIRLVYCCLFACHISIHMLFCLCVLMFSLDFLSLSAWVLHCCLYCMWISFVSLNADCTRLLVGHIRGQIVMWDMTSGKVLRTITNVHRPDISVLRVRFTEDRTLALSNDSTGSVFLLEFKRLIGVRTCDFQCLFSGSRGEVHFEFNFKI